jgi:hypothetical protein
MSESDPRNVPGDFYVEAGCCTLCGVPWHFAPELFRDDKSGCWVARQPANPVEHGKMLKVIEHAELDCIQYRGNDPKVVQEIALATAWRRKP